MKNKVLIFDKHTTLYYVGDKVEKRFKEKIVSYFVNKLNITEEKAKELIYELKKQYRYDSEAVDKVFSFSQKAHARLWHLEERGSFASPKDLEKSKISRVLI